jgi:hypothetical protein
MRVEALDDSAAVTLMSIDVERIFNGLRSFHDLWAALVEVSIAAWLLQRNLGIAFIAPVLLSLGKIRLFIFILTGFFPARKADKHKYLLLQA